MLKKIATTLTILISLAFPAMVPAVALAQESPEIQNGLCAGVNFDAAKANGTCNPNDPAAVDKINRVIRLVINLLSIIVGVIAVVMIIIGGLKYIISSGDSSNVQSAKNTIVYAIVGLIIVALAQFIVRFVLAKVAST